LAELEIIPREAADGEASESLLFNSTKTNGQSYLTSQTIFTLVNISLLSSILAGSIYLAVQSVRPGIGNLRIIGFGFLIVSLGCFLSFLPSQVCAVEGVEDGKEFEKGF
jgi:hypothetical protein